MFASAKHLFRQTTCLLLKAPHKEKMEKFHVASLKHAIDKFSCAQPNTFQRVFWGDKILKEANAVYRTNPKQALLDLQTAALKTPATSFFHNDFVNLKSALLEGLVEAGNANIALSAQADIIQFDLSLGEKGLKDDLTKALELIGAIALTTPGKALHTSLALASHFDRNEVLKNLCLKSTVDLLVCNKNVDPKLVATALNIIDVFGDDSVKKLAENKLGDAFRAQNRSVQRPVRLEGPHN